MADFPVRSGRGKQPLTSLLFCLSTSVPTWKMVAIFSTQQYLPRKERGETVFYLSQSGSKQSFPSEGRWASRVCRRGRGTTHSVCGCGSSWRQKGQAELHLPGRGAQLGSPGFSHISHARTPRTRTVTDQPQRTCWLLHRQGQHYRWSSAVGSLDHLVPDSLVG